jgi:tetratricopeptide (TPR) repeat protein
LATAEIKEGPAEAWLFWERGEAHAKVRRWKDAIADYTSALHLNPKNTLAYYHRGIAHRQLGDAGGREDCALAYHEDVNATATNTAAAATGMRRNIRTSSELNGDGRVYRDRAGIHLLLNRSRSMTFAMA